eukprot:1138600-Pelagomonas_calceolata.AAC.13
MFSVEWSRGLQPWAAGTRAFGGGRKRLCTHPQCSAPAVVRAQRAASPPRHNPLTWPGSGCWHRWPQPGWPAAPEADFGRRSCFRSACPQTGLMLCYSFSIH